MAAEIEDVFTNENDVRITKVVNDENDVTLIESFVNDNNEMVYNTYTLKDGGSVELVSDEEVDEDEECDEEEGCTDSIMNLYEKALANLIDDM